jgi:hypothetical protein
MSLVGEKGSMESIVTGYQSWLVPINVTNFYYGHWRIDVLGFYLNIFPMTT